MGVRQKAWARNAREQLFETLGRACVFCGATEQLQFDCIRPLGDAHHKLEFSARICFYRGQLEQGNLQVLCARCNAVKGADEHQGTYDLPF